MSKPCSFNLTLLLAVGLAGWMSACSSSTRSSQLVDSQAQTSASAVTATTPEKAAPVQPEAKTDSFKLAVERAVSADKLGRSAQSRDDWRLVASRWQQAVTLMKAVPASSLNRAEAQQKLGQYQQNLASAQQKANRPTTLINPNGVVVLPPVAQPPTRPAVRSAAPIAAAAPQSAAQPEAPNPPQSRKFYAPIVRRAGNTPVIRVTFNNSQPFDMIVDTGASGTLITRQMASQLGVKTVAQASVDTASQRNVTFPLGYVQSIAVGGAVAKNVLVAVAGAELDVGLLGHDFFGNYDVIIREREVEFQER